MLRKVVDVVVDLTTSGNFNEKFENAWGAAASGAGVPNGTLVSVIPREAGSSKQGFILFLEQ